MAKEVNLGPLWMAGDEVFRADENGAALASIYGVVADGSGLAEAGKRYAAGHADGLYVFVDHIALVRMPFRPGLATVVKLLVTRSVESTLTLRRLGRDFISEIDLLNQAPPGWSLIGEGLRFVKCSAVEGDLWFWVHTDVTDIPRTEAAIAAWNAGSGAAAARLAEMRGETPPD